MNNQIKSVVETVGKAKLTGLLPAFGRWFHFRNVSKSNKRANKYLTYQLNRLVKAKDEDLNFAISLSLIRRSSAYRVAMYNKVFKGWYWNQPMQDVQRTFHELDKIVSKLKKTIRYKRVYIPKPGKDTLRPLGVPSPAWRLYGSMWAHLMSVTMPYDELKYQHAYQGGKGCWSAWWYIITRFRKNGLEPMYEYDYKGFFDNINHSITSASLIKFWSYSHWRVLKILLCSRPTKFKLKPGDPEWKFKPRNNKYWKAWFNYSTFQSRGVPQGFSLSPLLAIMGANEVVPKDNHVMYADDGILYGQELPDKSGYFFKYSMINKPKAGLHVHETKSKLVEGELKFLGLIWNLKTNELYPTNDTTKVYSMSNITIDELKRILIPYQEQSSSVKEDQTIPRGFNWNKLTVTDFLPEVVEWADQYWQQLKTNSKSPRNDPFWRWEIVPYSMLRNRNIVLSWIILPINKLLKLFLGYNSLKVWNGILVDYLSMSTICTSELMKISRKWPRPKKYRSIPNY